MKIFMANHPGFLGFAIIFKLYHLGLTNLLLCTHFEVGFTLWNSLVWPRNRAMISLFEAKPLIIGLHALETLT
jgi:hypothetical protein